MKNEKNNAYLPFDKTLYESMGVLRNMKDSDEKIQPSILKIMEIVDREDFISRYELQDLPNELNLGSDEVLRMLYYKYTLAFAKLEDSYFLLPYVQQGNLDTYSRIRNLSLIPYTENEKLEEKYKKNNPLSSYVFKVIRTENDLKDTNEDELKAVIIKDYVSGLNVNYDLPRYQVNKSLLEVESYFIPYMRTSLKLATGVKMIAVNDEEEAEDVKTSLSRIDSVILSGVPFIPVTKKSDFQDFGNEPTATVQDYFLAMQSVDNLRLATLGLSNGGLFQKQERETISEQATNTVNASARLQANYNQLKYSIDLINKTFNLKIKIILRVDNEEKSLNEKIDNANKGFNNGQYTDIINNDIEGGDENV